MHLDNQIKLDFKDVLIRPKRSTLTSRSQVDITREIKFRWSPERFHAIPVIAANMDIVVGVKDADYYLNVGDKNAPAVPCARPSRHDDRVAQALQCSGMHRLLHRS